MTIQNADSNFKENPPAKNGQAKNKKSIDRDSIEPISIQDSITTLESLVSDSEPLRKAIAGALSKEEKKEIPYCNIRVVQGQAVVAALLAQINYPPKDYAFISALISRSEGRSKVKIPHFEIGKLIVGRISSKLKRESIAAKSYRDCKKSLKWQEDNGWKLFDVETGGMEYKKVEETITKNGKRKKVTTIEKVPHANIYTLHILNVAALLLKHVLPVLEQGDKAGTRVIEDCAVYYARQYLKGSVSVTSQIERRELTEEAKFHRKMKSITTSLQNALGSVGRNEKRKWTEYLKAQLDWINSGKLEEEIEMARQGEIGMADPSNPEFIKPTCFNPDADNDEGKDD